MQRYSLQTRLRPLLRILFVGVLTAVVSAFTLAVTIDGVARQAAPAFAIRFGGGDAQALANVAHAIMSAEGDTGALQEAERIARLAIQKDATIAEAFGVLGMVSNARGEMDLANLRFGHAAALSKRKLFIELWLARRFLATGDRKATVLHLDRALKVHKKSWPVILPVLVGTLDDRLFIDPITDRLATKPSWETNFLATAVSQTKSPDNLSKVFDRLEQLGAPVPQEVISHFAVRLASESKFDLAARQYERSKGVIPSGINNGGFETASVIKPFDWDFSYEAEYSAEPATGMKGANGRALRFVFSLGAPSVLLKQLVMLREGSYVLAGRYYLEELDRVTPPEWQVVCADRGERIAIAKLYGELGRWAEFRQQFEIPEYCRWQWIQLVRPSAVVEGGASGYFDDLILAGK